MTKSLHNMFEKPLLWCHHEPGSYLLVNDSVHEFAPEFIHRAERHRIDQSQAGSRHICLGRGHFGAISSVSTVRAALIDKEPCLGVIARTLVLAFDALRA